MKISVQKSDLQGEILIPASKSHTIRAITIAGLADGESILINPLQSADALSCVAGIKELGADVKVGKDLIIKGFGSMPIPRSNYINVGNSGTSLRILTAIASLTEIPVSFDGDSSIRNRPMTNLLQALEQLGATSVTKNGKCPFTIQGPIRGGKTKVVGVSSQFVTALLIASPLATGDTEIFVEQLNEQPYVEMTLDWLDKQGIRYERDGYQWFKVYGNQQYKPFKRQIPADFSSATFALSAAAITGSEILIKGLDFNDFQGDKAAFYHLEKMGVVLEHTSQGVLVKGGELNGIDIDMNATPDALPALSVVGCFAKGTTRLLNVPQARLKECDRIKAAYTELKKMGANIEELEDGLVIHHSKLHPAEVHGYDDHRMVMALAVAAMAIEGETIIDTAESISVTYPSFIRDFTKLGAQITQLNE